MTAETSERDTTLQSLFDAAEENLVDSAFTDQILRAMDRRRRRLLAVRVAIVAAIVLVEVVLESPLRTSTNLVVEALGRDLFPLGDGWLGFLAGPLNSVAGLVGLMLLYVNIVFRKVVQ